MNKPKDAPNNPPRPTTELGLKRLPPVSELGFGKHYCAKMILSLFENGKWGAPKCTDLDFFSMHPGAKVLHYAQEIFEGLKAFRAKNGKIQLFRPELNIQRMSRSAEIMAMPAFPEKDYLDGLVKLVSELRDFVPEEPGALYLRPTMIATTTTLGVAPASDYVFYILASPVGGYFGNLPPGEPASISVLVSEKYVRAVRGGLGSAKTGANYAASLRAVAEAKSKKYDNVLFLDAIERKYIEELSGMNVFFVKGDTLITPILGDTILDGTTRRSILEIAQHEGQIKIEERAFSLDELTRDVQAGKITEAFACGTGASITAISKLGISTGEVMIGHGKPGSITKKLYQTLTEIQFGRKTPPQSNWCIEV
jgi:branched-chain amino acid aminotransferase